MANGLMVTPPAAAEPCSSTAERSAAAAPLAAELAVKRTSTPSVELVATSAERSPPQPTCERRTTRTTEPGATEPIAAEPAAAEPVAADSVGMPATEPAIAAADIPAGALPSVAESAAIEASSSAEVAHLAMAADALGETVKAEPSPALQQEAAPGALQPPPPQKEGERVDGRMQSSSSFEAGVLEEMRARSLTKAQKDAEERQRELRKINELLATKAAAKELKAKAQDEARRAAKAEEARMLNEQIRKSRAATSGQEPG